MILNSIAEVLLNSGKIAVLPHVSADGDAIGSSLALALALERLGAGVKIFLEEKIPLVYGFLPGQNLTGVYEKGEQDVFDVAVALDTGDTGRLGTRIDIFNKARKKINIDHHPTNTGFAELNRIDPNSSAVGEIIYELLKIMKSPVTKDMASCLYVAIATDTGSFRYSSTTPRTHQITAELISCGIDVADLSQKVFDTTSLEKVRLTGLAAESLQLLEDGRIALLTITDEMMSQSGAAEEDCDGIVNMGRNIRGVDVALMIRSRNDGEVKVNLRSNTDVDVSKIAKDFSGGGHKKAAGFSVKGNMEDVKARLLETVKNTLKQDGSYAPDRL